MIPQPIEQSEQIKLPRATKAKSKLARDIGPVTVPNPEGERMPPQWEGRPASKSPRPGVYHDAKGGQTIYVPDTTAGGPNTTAVRSLRDPLAKLHHTKRIDNAQYRAGRKMQALLETAEIGAVRGQDPTREYVDGGGAPEVLSDRQIRAIRDLQAIWAILGPEDALFVRAVLADGTMPEEYGRRHGATGEKKISHWGWLFARLLSRLAVHLGMAT